MEKFKIKDVLIVASEYDVLLLEEEGRLQSLLAKVYHSLEFDYVPNLNYCFKIENIINFLEEKKYDLLIYIPRLNVKETINFGKSIREKFKGIPFVLLCYDSPETFKLLESPEKGIFDGIFLWMGDGKILAGIIQYMEDKVNSKTCSTYGNYSILILEDSIHHYSNYISAYYETLNEIYSNILKNTNSYFERQEKQKYRPFLNLAIDLEEGLEIYNLNSSNLLGIISDLNFKVSGKQNSRAGIIFLEKVREKDPYIPFFIQSSEISETEEITKQNAITFEKNEKMLIKIFKSHLKNLIGFGEIKIGENIVLQNLRDFYKYFESIKDEDLEEVIKNGSLFRWLGARGEIELLNKLKKAESLNHLKELILKERKERFKGSLVNYSRFFFEEGAIISRLGNGSIGGKARGLVFIDKILSKYLKDLTFQNVKIEIPKSLVVATDIFDQFMEENRLWEMALQEENETIIALSFLKASFPPTYVGDLFDFISKTKNPLAIRSSSLLEDSLYQPFAGVYWTKMIPNNENESEKRFRNLLNAIKLVYASTFFRVAKAYINSTNHRQEEEKMAVLIQEVVGNSYRTHYYPNFSGVARSINLYPFGGAKPEDGIVNLALGLGKTIVDGGVSLKFCPKYPEVLPQFMTIDDMLKCSQKDFFAIDLSPAFIDHSTEEDEYLKKFDLNQALKDGTLNHISSTYSITENKIVDTIDAPGPKIITFANILKYKIFPLPEIIDFLLKLSEDSLGCPVEIEFAVKFDPLKVFPVNFYFLQVRPMVAIETFEEFKIDEIERDKILIYSNKVLGNGKIDIENILYVKPENFNASITEKIAYEIKKLNYDFMEKREKYLLIGPGRWGSSDSWLGIPVKWSDISEAKVIVEVALPNMNVEPSQGSHFFQNITSLRIGYITIPLEDEKSFIDFEFLKGIKGVYESEYLKLIKFEKPLTVLMNGRKQEGVVLKNF